MKVEVIFNNDADDSKYYMKKLLLNIKEVEENGNLKNKKAIIYNRVSTIMQEKSESLSEQTDECIKFCKEKGYDIFKVFKDVKSGTINDREGYLELKKHIEREKILIF